jgi:IclR family pca regulon transcriptional regulator
VPRVRTGSDRIGAGGEWLPSVPSLPGQQFSHSLERGLAILGCFTPERPVLGIAEIAEELGMSRSTTHRYVSTLAALGYLRRGARRRYRLALGVTALGMSAMNGMSLEEHAQAYLKELRDRTGFTVGIGVLDGPEVLLVDRLPGGRRGQQQIDLGQAPGSRLPAHCTATGKLLLAQLPESERRTAISETALTRHTANTITSKRALREELESIREQSIVVAEEELAPGLYSIAAPVRSASREVIAAVGMDAHSSMIPLGDLVDALGPHLIAAADGISARLGYRRDDELHSRGANAPGPIAARRGWPATSLSGRRASLVVNLDHRKISL